MRKGDRQKKTFKKIKQKNNKRGGLLFGTGEYAQYFV